MRPAEFTTETIIEAGQVLLDEGRTVTGFALRQKIGGGNPNRLKKIWDEFISKQIIKPAEAIIELPVEFAEEVVAITHVLAEQIAALAIELNNKATKTAERRVSEIAQAADQQRAQSARELADAAHTLVDLETRLAESQSHRQAQTIELAQMRARLAVSEQAAKLADQLRIDLDAARREIAEARETAAKQTGQLEALTAQYTALLAAIQSQPETRYAVAGG